MTTIERDVQKILGPLCRMYWGKCILFAARRGAFCEHDAALALDWPTCACGKMYYRKPFACVAGTNAKVPSDDYLGELGDAFGSFVKKDNILEAARTMVRIEDHGANLLKWRKK